MALKQGSKYLGKSTKAGQNEILYVKNVLASKGAEKGKFQLEISFESSVMAIHTYHECPHVLLELSILPTSELSTLNSISGVPSYSDSEDKLDKMFKQINQIIPANSDAAEVDKEKLTHSLEHSYFLECPDAGLFQLKQRKMDTASEVIYSHAFSLAAKMGIFAEIFYNPYMAEVLRISIHSVKSTVSTTTYDISHFGAQKAIWADLEAGEYYFEIVALRDPQKKVDEDLVKFQLIFDFQQMRIGRDRLMPKSLNYMGLLGYGSSQTVNFEETTLFFDDLTMKNHTESVSFTLSQEASVIAQIQQPSEKFIVSIHKAKNKQDKSHHSADIGQHFSRVISSEGDASNHVQAVFVDSLKANQKYYLVIKHRSHIVDEGESISEAAEEDPNSQFSLKIHFSNGLQAHQGGTMADKSNSLPRSIDQISRNHKWVPGMHPSAFVMGTRPNLKLFQQDLQGVAPYQPMNDEVYRSHQQTRSKDEKLALVGEPVIIAKIPFKVEAHQENFYAGLYDYCHAGASMLNLAIMGGEENQLISMATQGKYYSALDTVVLPKGSYNLVVLSDRQDTTHEDSLYEFGLDVVRQDSNMIDPDDNNDTTNTVKEDIATSTMEALQLCQIPTMPTTLNTVGNLHSLSGEIVDTYIPAAIRALDSGSRMNFKLDSPSFVTVYVETPEDVPVALSIESEGGIEKSIALSSDQDTHHSNFLAQKGFKKRNVALLREFLAEGNYVIQVKQVANDETEESFDQSQVMCNLFTLGVTVAPVTSAKHRWLQYPHDTAECELTEEMPKQLTTGTLTKGTFNLEMTTMVSTVSYFDLLHAPGVKMQEGPFMVYFQLEYDMHQEGPLAVVLFKFDKGAGSFEEIGLFETQDGQSMMFKVVEKGTYAVSIQSIASTSSKYTQKGLSDKALRKDNFFTSNCVTAKYTYLINSVNTDDVSTMHLNFSEIVQARAIAGRTHNALPTIAGMIKKRDQGIKEDDDDLGDISSFFECQHDEVPASLPIVSDGFDRTYTFKAKAGAKSDIILLPVEDSSVIRLYMNMGHSKAKVSATLLPAKSQNEIRRKQQQKKGVKVDEEDIDEVLAASDPATHQFVSFVPAVDEGDAYRLKIEYDMEEQEAGACQLFTLRIAAKPLGAVAAENLACSEDDAALPPASIKIPNTGAFRLEDSTFAVSSQWLEENQVKGKYKSHYDIHIDFESADHYFNTEMSTDFLTGLMSMKLYAKDVSAKKNVKIGVSEWVNENSKAEVNHLSTEDSSDKPFKQKIKALDNGEDEDVSQSKSLILRIKFQKGMYALLTELKNQSKERSEETCFNFDLNIFAKKEEHKADPESESEIEKEKKKSPQEKQHDAEQNTIVRVDWHGSRSSAHHFYKSTELTAFIEFEKPVAKSLYIAMQAPKAIYLDKDSGEVGSDDDVEGESTPQTSYFMHMKKQYARQVSPNEVKLSTKDQRILVLTFNENGEFAAGHSYSLEMPFYAKRFGEYDKPHHKAVFFSNCECDHEGTSNCTEHGKHKLKPKCQCKRHHTGKDCSECIKGFAKDKMSGQCRKNSSCAANGGKEHCQGHGECKQEGDFARCHCEPGFATDGLKQCGKCEDPLMKYPDMCGKQRSWVLDNSYECKDLETLMPKDLYMNSDAIDTHHAGRIVYQQDDGQLNWAGRYSLFNRLEQESHKGSNGIKTYSEHKFMVLSPAHFRLYIQTFNSAVKVRYSILNHENVIVHQSEHFQKHISDYQTISMDTEEDLEKPKETPYTLKVEYEHMLIEHQNDDKTLCPMMEIHFAVMNTAMHQDAIKCTTQESKHAKELQTEIKKAYTLQENLTVREQVVVPSSIEPSKTDGLIHSEDDYYAHIEIELDVPKAQHKKGVLSVISMYNFESNEIKMKLVPILEAKSLNNKKAIVEIEKVYMLDHASSFHSTHKASDKDRFYVADKQTKQHGDTVSALEVPHIKAGKYTLQISVPKAAFVFTPKFETCLKFDLNIEYMALNKETDSSVIQVLSVMPDKLVDLTTDDTLSLELNFQYNAKLKQLAKSINKIEHICRLMPASTSYKLADLKIKPSKTFYREKHAILDFDFSAHAKVINDNLGTEHCYNLICDAQPGAEYKLDLKRGKTEYCFKAAKANLPHGAQVMDIDSCNPYSAAKFEDGACICPFPYTGTLCEQCMDGFKEIKEEEIFGEAHNMCIGDAKSEKYNCNYHGELQQGSCKCNPAFAGDHCDRCSNDKMLYPDCTTLDQDNIESTEGRVRSEDIRVEDLAGDAYSEDNNKDTDSVFQQSCKSINYPKSFDKIHLHREFATGQFHIADTYQANGGHHVNNIMFMPRRTGQFKIMIKEPLTVQAKADGETLNFSLKITESDGGKVLKTASNQSLLVTSVAGEKTFDDFRKNKSLDFIQIELPIHQEMVDQEMMIDFYVHNQNIMENKAHPCVSVYIEAEFEPESDEDFVSGKVACDSKLPALVSDPNDRPTLLSTVKTKTVNNGWGDDDKNVYTFQHQFDVAELDDGEDALDTDINKKKFFYSKQYFVDNTEPGKFYPPQAEILIQVEQKFMDVMTFLPIIEILETGLENLNDAKQHDHTEHPDCSTNHCILSAQKSYNSFSLKFTASPGTLLRVWIAAFEELTPKNADEAAEQILLKKEAAGCSNFKFDMVVVKMEQLDRALKEFEDLATLARCDTVLSPPPTSLNVERYFGTDEQRDFNQLRRYRIDNTHVTGIPQIKFELKEEHTQFRLAALPHAQMEFDVSLVGKVGNIQLDQARNTAQGSEEIYTVLPKGEYILKLNFITENPETGHSITSQPCQSINLQIAARALKIDPKHTEKNMAAEDLKDLTLENIMENKSQKTDTLEWRTFWHKPEVTYGQVKEAKKRILLSQKFQVNPEDAQGNSLMIDIMSDFINGDVNFHLENDQGHFIQPTLTTERQKRLYLDNLYAGTWKLVIFTEQLLLKMRDLPVEILNQLEMPSDFFVYFNVITQDERVKQAHIVRPYNAVTKKYERTVSHVHFVHKKQLKCMVRHTEIASNIMDFPRNLGNSHVQTHNLFVTKPQIAFGQPVEIRFKATKETVLIIVNSKKIADMKLLEANQTELAVGENDLNMSTFNKRLYYTGLKKGEQYIIQFHFGKNRVLKEGCIPIGLFVQQTNKSEVEQLCKGPKVIPHHDQPHIKVKANMKDQEVQYFHHEDHKGIIIEPMDRNMDLTLTVDFSGMPYAPLFHLDLKEEEDKNKKAFGDESVLYGEQAPAQVDYINSKGQLKILYSSLIQGKYVLKVIQQGRPKKCENTLTITMQGSYSPIHTGDAEAPTPENVWSSYGHRAQTFHQSRWMMSQHEHYKGVVRVAQPLPIDLNSFKYLNTYNTQNQHLLVSEWVELSQDDAHNKILFNYQSETNKKATPVRIRVSVEDDATIQFKLFKGDKFIRNAFNGFINELIEGNGIYSIQIVHLTTQTKHKKLLHGLKSVQLTISVTSQDFFKSNYVDYHGKALKKCQVNVNFPLALEKHTDVQTDESQSYYDYPLIRAHQTKFRAQYGGFLDTKYAFRFNETTHVHFEIGSNFATSHIQLQLSSSGKTGVPGKTLIGKQIGNTNVVEGELPQGDYLVKLHQHDSADNLCALYDFSGIISPLSSQLHHDGDGAAVLTDGTCEIKGDTMPEMIYAKQTDTRHGNEEFVNTHGAFLDQFLKVLMHPEEVAEGYKIAKSETLIGSLASTSILKVLVRREDADIGSGKIEVKLGGVAEDSQAPLARLEDVNGGTDVTYLFKLEPNKNHFLIFQEELEANDEDQDEGDLCKYFNAVISIESLHNIGAKMQKECVGKELFTGLPHEMKGDSSLDVKKFCIKMHKNDETHPQEASIIIDHKENNAFQPYTIDSEIFYDFPILDFGMSVTKPEHLEADESPAEDDIDKTETILSAQGNVLITDSHHKDKLTAAVRNKLQGQIRQEGQVTFKINEQIGHIIAKEVRELKVFKNAELYSHVTLSLKVHGGEEEGHVDLTKFHATKPTVASFLFIAGENDTDDVSDPFEELAKTKQESLGTQEKILSFENTKSVSVVIFLAGGGEVSEASIKQAVKLQSSIDNQNLVGFAPAHVDIDHPQKISTLGESQVDSMAIVTIDFEVSGAAILPNNGGDTNELGYKDEHIKLYVKIAKDEITDMKSGNAYEIDPMCTRDLESKHLNMALPRETIIDDKIKDKVKEEHSGTEKDVTDLEDEGEAAEKEAGLDGTQAEYLECGCVNGDCEPGKSECKSCHAGWHGDRCDIEDKSKQTHEDEIEEKEDLTFGGEEDLDNEDIAPVAHDLGTTEGILGVSTPTKEETPKQHRVASSSSRGGSSGGSMQSPSTSQHTIVPQATPTPVQQQPGRMGTMQSLTQVKPEPIHYSDSNAHATHSVFGPGGLVRKAIVSLFWALVYCLVIVVAGFAVWWTDNEFKITDRISTWWTRQQLAQRKKDQGPESDDEEELMTMADGNHNQRRRKQTGHQPDLLDPENDQYEAGRQPQSESEGEKGPDLNLFDQESSDDQQDNEAREMIPLDEINQQIAEQPLIDFGAPMQQQDSQVDALVNELDDVLKDNNSDGNEDDFGAFIK